MRSQTLITALMAALLFPAGQAKAQQQQAVPDAPQPQKKPAAKPSSSDSAAPAPATPATKAPGGSDDNAFPEAVSQEAATKAAQEDKSDSPPPPPSTGTDKKPAAEANPFPEDVSRDAAKAAGNDASPASVPSNRLPPGVSSSQSSSLSEQDQGQQVTDPARAKKDTEVGSFYLKTKDYQGALLRFNDASKADPTNVNAIFGLAETQRLLGKKAEAARNYQLYLDIVPNGSKAKESMKALKMLQTPQ